MGIEPTSEVWEARNYDNNQNLGPTWVQLLTNEV
jgi:hypothetical protein